ncbi:hypothetical protein CapIbe_005678 [Capra ibex]
MPEPASAKEHTGKANPFSSHLASVELKCFEHPVVMQHWVSSRRYEEQAQRSPGAGNQTVLVWREKSRPGLQVKPSAVCHPLFVFMLLV